MDPEFEPEARDILREKLIDDFYFVHREAWSMCHVPSPAATASARNRQIYIVITVANAAGSIFSSLGECIG